MKFCPFAAAVFLLVATGEGGTVFAQKPDRPSDASLPKSASALNLAQLEATAVEHNPALAQAAARIAAARGKYVQAGLYPNPVAGYIGEEMGIAGTAGFQGAFVGQEVVTAGKLRLDRAVAVQEIRQAEHQYRAQQQRVLNDVRAAYYEVLTAQRSIDLTGDLVRIGDEGLRAAERLFDAKEVSRVDVLEAQIEADSTQLKLQNAQNRGQAAWRRLAAILGLPDLPPAPLSGSLEDVPHELAWDGVLERLLSESPELAEAQAGVQRARSFLARQCAQRVPNLNLQTAVQHDNESGDNIARVEVSLPLPLFNRNQGNIAKAEAELVAADNEVRRVELVLQDRLAATFQRYSDARQQVETYKSKILPNSKTSLDLIRNAYQQGEIGYIGLLTSQRTYSSAQLSYLEALRQLHTNRVAIEGLLLGGGLRQESQPLSTGD
jgi:cobalt-zinc-cadmium efflux system outer membrane protein